MSGQNSVTPLSPMLNHAPLICAQSHRDTILMNSWNNFQSQKGLGTQYPWTSLRSYHWSNGSDMILVIIDHLTKQLIFIPTINTIMSPMPPKLFVLHVFSKHGVPLHITSNHGMEFISAFFCSLSKVLDMKLHFTSGYHPEGEGQTEHANQTHEQYLQVYCNYQENNWSNLLPIAEFAYNNAPNATTGLSPFYTNKGCHPNLSIHPKWDIASTWAWDYVVDLDELHQRLHSHISDAQKWYSASANRHWSLSLGFKISDKVFIKSDNIHTTQPSKKLTEKFLGPFEILDKMDVKILYITKFSSALLWQWWDEWVLKHSVKFSDIELGVWSWLKVKQNHHCDTWGHVIGCMWVSHYRLRMLL